MNLHALARSLGGESWRNSVLFPGPGHSAADRSAKAEFDPRYPDGVLCHSFAGDDPMEIKRIVLAALAGAPPLSYAEKPRKPLDDRERTAQALAIWAEAKPPAGTPVEPYLKRRGLILPPGSDCVGWH